MAGERVERVRIGVIGWLAACDGLTFPANSVNWSSCGIRRYCFVVNIVAIFDELAQRETVSDDNEIMPSLSTSEARHDYCHDYVVGERRASRLIGPDPFAMTKTIVPIIDKFFMN